MDRRIFRATYNKTRRQRFFSFSCTSRFMCILLQSEKQVFGRKKATFGDFGRFKCTRRGNRCAVLTETVLNLGSLGAPPKLPLRSAVQVLQFSDGKYPSWHSETKFRCGVWGFSDMILATQSGAPKTKKDIGPREG